MTKPHQATKRALGRMGHGGSAIIVILSRAGHQTPCDWSSQLTAPIGSTEPVFRAKIA